MKHDHLVYMFRPEQQSEACQWTFSHLVYVFKPEQPSEACQWTFSHLVYVFRPEQPSETCQRTVSHLAYIFRLEQPSETCQWTVSHLAYVFRWTCIFGSAPLCMCNMLPFCRLKEQDDAFNRQRQEYEREIRHLRLMLKEKEELIREMEGEKKYVHFQLLFWSPPSWLTCSTMQPRNN